MRPTQPLTLSSEATDTLKSSLEELLQTETQNQSGEMGLIADWVEQIPEDISHNKRAVTARILALNLQKSKPTSYSGVESECA